MMIPASLVLSGSFSHFRAVAGLATKRDTFQISVFFNQAAARERDRHRSELLAHARVFPGVRVPSSERRRQTFPRLSLVAPNAHATRFCETHLKRKTEGKRELFLLLRVLFVCRETRFPEVCKSALTRRDRDSRARIFAKTGRAGFVLQAVRVARRQLSHQRLCAQHQHAVPGLRERLGLCKARRRIRRQTQSHSKLSEPRGLSENKEAKTSANVPSSLSLSLSRKSVV